VLVPLFDLRVRPAVPSDAEVIARQSYALWSGTPLESHLRETIATIAGKPESTMPLVIFVAEVRDRIVGFIEVGLRSHADGCHPSRPAGFIEGWFVDAEHRQHGVGKALMHAAEGWARAQGCRELASDTWLDHHVAQRAHEALGFDVVDRCVNYRKRLA
jgi:aminoglycoside 6'-N-acetyltransferase I